MTTTARVIIYLLGINAVTFLAFGLDKYFAVKSMWRISEAKLLFMSLIGGSGGGFAGSRLFRHKTRKEPFRSYFRAIVLFQMIGAAVYFVPPLRALARQLVAFLTQ
ncbi:MAG: DUF1294 domain-containing protein [Alphaproteobacteria bacterium]|nr:DUF1294 domain-containing protein [Alphaproteobacteria bacterium]